MLFSRMKIGYCPRRLYRLGKTLRCPKIRFYMLKCGQTQKTVFDHISTHEEKAENTTSSGVFLINVKVFGNVMKHYLECLIYLLNRDLN